MKIGEAARETGLSVSNIRFYERKGLLAPKRQKESQYREYKAEDVRRLKEVMLLRKMGLSVESIYLLYEGQADLQSLIRRRQAELKEQIEQLNGSLELCRMLSQEPSMDGMDVDICLRYVREEEKKGKRFAEAEELLEDLTEFTRLASFRYDPYVGRFFQKQCVARTLAVLIALSLVLAAVSSVVHGGGYMGRAVIWFWSVYLLCLGMNFLYFRRWKHRDDKKEDGR